MHIIMLSKLLSFFRISLLLLSFDHLGQRDVLQSLPHAFRHLLPDVLRDTGRSASADRGVVNTVDKAQGTLQDIEDLLQGDALRRPPQDITAVRTPRGGDEPRRLQRVDQLPEILRRDRLAFGDVLQEDRAVPIMEGKIEHQPPPVAPPCRQFHQRTPYSSPLSIPY